MATVSYEQIKDDTQYWYFEDKKTGIDISPFFTTQEEARQWKKSYKGNREIISKRCEFLS